MLLVTSAVAGEGKSTLALSLARAYAAAGIPPLLIDANLRHPSLHRLLGLMQPVGLGDYLQAEAQDGAGPDIRSLLVADPLSEARVVIGAEPSAVPTDSLVAGDAFRRLVEVGRGHFGITIIDSPPLAAATDAIHLAQLADVILLVVQSTTTPQGEVRSTLARLRDGKPATAEILLVLNHGRAASWPSFATGRLLRQRWQHLIGQ